MFRIDGRPVAFSEERFLCVARKRYGGETLTHVRGSFKLLIGIGYSFCMQTYGEAVKWNQGHTREKRLKALVQMSSLIHSFLGIASVYAFPYPASHPSCCPF